MHLKIFKRLSHSYSLSLAPIPQFIYNIFIERDFLKKVILKDIFQTTYLIKKVYIIIGLKSNKHFQKVISLNIKKHNINNNSPFSWSWSSQTYDKLKTTFEINIHKTKFQFSSTPYNTAYHTVNNDQKSIFELRGKINNIIISKFEDSRNEIIANDQKIKQIKIYNQTIHDYHKLAHEYKKQFNATNIATMIHRVAKLTHMSNLGEYCISKHEMFLSEIILMAQNKITELQENHIAIIMWSLGKIGYGVKDISTLPSEFNVLAKKLVIVAENKLDRFLPQNISNFLLGFAYLKNDSCHRLYFRMAIKVKKQISNYRILELANIIWSMATLEFNDIVNFVGTFVNHTKTRSNEFKSEEISSVMWSLATMKYYDCEELLKKFLMRLLDLKDEKRIISDQSIANLLWSAQQLHIKINDEVIDGLLNQWKVKINPSDKTKISQIEFMNIANFKAQHVANILFALADFGYRTKNANLFVKASIDFFRNRWHLLNGQDIGNYLWSLLIFDDNWLDKAMLLEGIDKYKEYGFHKMRLRDIRQMYQCILHIKMFNPNVDLSECLPKNIEEHWKKIWSERQKTSPLPKWLADVLVTYESMGYPCKNRFLINDSVNTSTIEIKKAKIAIEGISYLRRFQNLPGQPIMRFYWKLKILKKLGYSILLIDQVEWEHLKGKDRIEFLKSKLNEIIIT